MQKKDVVATIRYHLLLDFICKNSNFELNSENIITNPMSNYSLIDEVVNHNFNLTTVDGLEIFGKFVPVDSSFYEKDEYGKYEFLRDVHESTLLDQGYTFDEIEGACREVVLEKWPNEVVNVMGVTK